MLKKILIICGYIAVCSVVLIGIFSPKPLIEFKGRTDLYFHFIALLICTVWSRVVFMRIDWRLFAGVLLLVVLLLEPIQGWLLSTRVFSLLDLAANALGACVGLMICVLWVNKRRLSIN